MVELQEIQRFFALLAELPPLGAYAIIAAGSALENVFPPVPSDTFVVLGAVLSDRGGLSAARVLIVAWVANVAGAMFVYYVARRRGPDFFTDGWGRRVLRPHQFDRVSRFYARYGLWAILFSRFLPVLRVVIPTFAGFAHLGWVRTLVPVALASLFWYAVVLTLGIFASQNVGRVVELLGNTNAWLLLVAGLIGLGIAVWWWRTRHEHDEHEASRPRRREGDDDASGPRP